MAAQVSARIHPRSRRARAYGTMEPVPWGPEGEIPSATRQSCHYRSPGFCSRTRQNKFGTGCAVAMPSGTPGTRVATNRRPRSASGVGLAVPLTRSDRRRTRDSHLARPGRHPPAAGRDPAAVVGRPGGAVRAGPAAAWSHLRRAADRLPRTLSAGTWTSSRWRWTSPAARAGPAWNGSRCGRWRWRRLATTVMDYRRIHGEWPAWVRSRAVDRLADSPDACVGSGALRSGSPGGRTWMPRPRPSSRRLLPCRHGAAATPDAPFFIEDGTRRAHLAGITAHRRGVGDREARNLLMNLGDRADGEVPDPGPGRSSPRPLTRRPTAAGVRIIKTLSGRPPAGRPNFACHRPSAASRLAGTLTREGKDRRTRVGAGTSEYSLLTSFKQVTCRREGRAARPPWAFRA